jgi:hypothetical protein
VDAVAGELVRRDVIPEAAGRCDLGQQVLDQVMDMLLGSGEVRPPMQECGEFRAGVLVGKAVVGDERVGLQHGFQPLASVAGLIAEFPELCKVGGDLTFGLATSAAEGVTSTWCIVPVGLPFKAYPARGLPGPLHMSVA